jgi:hypothetical protein
MAEDEHCRPAVERDARHERVLANARRTRELAERAQAKLDAQRSGGSS